MYKMLIVDDEAMICNGVKAFLDQWEEFEFEWIRTAMDGEEAWEQIKKEKPDVVITDISMPQMDGIDLLKRMRQQGVEAKVVVLSGYSDFEYVKSMALLGIENYLLKPVNEEELYSTLDSTFKKIQTEIKEQLKAQLDSNLLKENIINRWICGTISERELEERAQFLNLNLNWNYFQPCCFKILGKVSEKESDLKQKVYETCMEILQQNPACYATRNYEGDIITIFCFEEAEDAAGMIAEAVNKCLARVEGELRVKLYVLLGKVVDSYWEVPESFQEVIAGGVHLREIEEETLDLSIVEQNSNCSPLSISIAQYILKHYEQDLSLKTMANHFKGNAAYIGQVFKRDMKQSFINYLKDVRLEKAKELLKCSALTTKEIAQKVGFKNDTYFCTVFKKEMGISPAEYRRISIKK